MSVKNFMRILIFMLKLILSLKFFYNSAYYLSGAKIMELYDTHVAYLLFNC